jgi:hypothetical protein
MGEGGEMKVRRAGPDFVVSSHVKNEPGFCMGFVLDKTVCVGLGVHWENETLPSERAQKEGRSRRTRGGAGRRGWLWWEEGGKVEIIP